MVVKSFEKWQTEDLQLTFGIKPKQNSVLMDNWLKANDSLSDEQKNTLENLRERLSYFVNYWNEQDLKNFFIMPIINLIDFCHLTKYRTFMEHVFAADVVDIHNNTVSLRGRVEMVVATGEQKPRNPFFFLNEYKPQLKIQTDPQGQLLSAMLAAQANNQSDLAIYGMYNIGQLWFFVVLERKEYTITKAIDATNKQDLDKIVSMLQFVKNHIENIINSSK